MTDIPPGYYKVNMPQELRSRGTGERVLLHEVTPFDLMPQLIGSRFQELPGLQDVIHQDEVVNLNVPFLTAVTAYKEYAALEIARGNVEAAINAYKTSLFNTASFMSFASGLGEAALLTSGEVERLDLEGQFGTLEDKIIDKVWEGEVAFHPDDYAKFVADVREQRKRRRELGRSFFENRSAREYDPEVGRQYINACVAVKDFRMAAYVASVLDIPAEEAQHLAAYKALPQDEDNPELRALVTKHLPRSSFD